LGRGPFNIPARRHAYSLPSSLGDKLRSLPSPPLVVLALSSPVILVILGIAYGGLFFWAGLGGLALLSLFIIARSGAARNFEASNLNQGRSLFLEFSRVPRTRRLPLRSPPRRRSVRPHNHACRTNIQSCLRPRTLVIWNVPAAN